jgi:hypothetical protein
MAFIGKTLGPGAGLGVVAALLLAFGLAGAGALDAFFYLATIGALSLPILSRAGSWPGSRSRPPCRDCASESAKASRCTEIELGGSPG